MHMNKLLQAVDLMDLVHLVQDLQIHLVLAWTMYVYFSLWSFCLQ